MTAVSVDVTVGSLIDQMGRLMVVRPQQRAGDRVTQEQDDGGELNVKKAAELLGVSRWTLRRLDRSQLPYREVGLGTGREPNRRYRMEDVENLRLARAGVPGQVEELKTRVAELERRLDEHEEGHP